MNLADSEDSAARGSRRGVLVGLTLLTLAGGATAWLWIQGTRPAPTPIQRPALWLEGALANQAAAPYSELWGHLVVVRAALPSSVRHQGAGTPHQGASPLNEAHEASCFRLEPALDSPPDFGGPYTQCLFPGPLPAGQPSLTFVGVWTREQGAESGAMFEVMAYSESQRPQGSRWIFGPPRARNLHAGILRARRTAGQVFQPIR